MTITLGFKEFENTILGILLFERKRGLDFLLNKLNGNIILVVESKVMCEDFESALRFIVLNIPSRRFTGN